MQTAGDPIVKRLGLRVRELRRQRGLSQERLAELAGMHRNYIGALERAELSPTFLSVSRLARALGTTVCGLYPYE